MGRVSRPNIARNVTQIVTCFRKKLSGTYIARWLRRERDGGGGGGADAQREFSTTDSHLPLRLLLSRTASIPRRRRSNPVIPPRPTASSIGELSDLYIASLFVAIVDNKYIQTQRQRTLTWQPAHCLFFPIMLLSGGWIPVNFVVYLSTPSGTRCCRGTTAP